MQWIDRRTGGDSLVALAMQTVWIPTYIHHISTARLNTDRTSNKSSTQPTSVQGMTQRIVFWHTMQKFGYLTATLVLQDALHTRAKQRLANESKLLLPSSTDMLRFDTSI
eukprot:3678175-Amphidinium_carterae.1